MRYVQIKKYSKYHQPSWEEKQQAFEKKVKKKCIIPTKSGTFVQSKGEQAIADYLYEHDYEFIYDECLKFDEKLMARPDFYLKEHGIAIEYRGMLKDCAENHYYELKKERKRALYKQEGLRLIEIYVEQLPFLDKILRRELRSVIRKATEPGPQLTIL